MNSFSSSLPYVFGDNITDINNQSQDNNEDENDVEVENEVV